MLTETDREERRVYFTNRFRDKSFEGDLQTSADDTAEVIELNRRIKNAEVELRDLNTELHVVKMAHRKVIDEQRVRIAKAALGVRDTTEALLTEVHDRAQQVKKLRGEDLGWRSRRGGDYPAVRQFVKSGTFGNGYNERDFHPLFVEQSLLGSAVGVLGEDNTKKGEALYDKVYDRFMKVRNEHIDAGQPVDRKDDYELRVQQLETEGMTRSDAQAVADAELEKDNA
jgi:hypothetical protein